MKKIIIFATIIAIILSFAGCSTGMAKKTMVETTIVTTEPTETTLPVGAPTEAIIESTAETMETIGEFYWPTFGIAEKLPEVDWTNRGQIYVDSPDSFYCDIYDTDLKTFGDYVSACQELGYTVDYYNIPGSTYYANNKEGYTLTVAYYKDNDRMSISLYNYPET